MRHSQYLDAYLDDNDLRVAGGSLPITIGTFLTQTLSGRAKNYGGKYGQALKRSCIAAGALEVESKGGGRAYIRAQGQIARVEALAKEFFNCKDATMGIGEKGASLWIHDPQRGHYLDAHDSARFYNWATKLYSVRFLAIHPDVLRLIVLSWKAAK